MVTRCSPVVRLLSATKGEHKESQTYRPKCTVMCDPTATCAPGRGDCSRATPLPTASRSSPASCAASMATRTFLPRNDGTSIPPSATSRTTVPPLGNFGGAESSDCEEDWMSGAPAPGGFPAIIRVPLEGAIEGALEAVLELGRSDSLSICAA